MVSIAQKLPWFVSVSHFHLGDAVFGIYIFKQKLFTHHDNIQ
jgi:hypothetical protein